MWWRPPNFHVLKGSQSRLPLPVQRVVAPAQQAYSAAYSDRKAATEETIEGKCCVGKLSAVLIQSCVGGLSGTAGSPLY